MLSPFFSSNAMPHNSIFYSLPTIGRYTLPAPAK
jgi:hypothetical protein